MINGPPRVCERCVSMVGQVLLGRFVVASAAARLRRRSAVSTAHSLLLTCLAVKRCSSSSAASAFRPAPPHRCRSAAAGIACARHGRRRRRHRRPTDGTTPPSRQLAEAKSCGRARRRVSPSHAVAATPSVAIAIAADTGATLQLDCRWRTSTEGRRKTENSGGGKRRETQKDASNHEQHMSRQ